MVDFDDNYDKKHTFNRRSFLIGGIQATLMAGLGTRLYYLANLRSSHYQTLANENRIKLRLLLPTRALIYDCQGQVLASNQPNYRLILLPQPRENLLVSLQLIDRLIGLQGYSCQELLTDIQNSKNFIAYHVREHLTWDEVCTIELHALHLKGFAIERGDQRFYPFGPTFAHTVGYVQIPTDEDDIEKKMLYAPDFRTGKFGLEKNFDQQLSGQSGFEEIEINAMRKPIRTLAVKKSVQGQALTLTLDLRLQAFIVDLLKKYESASVVAMDVQSGAVKALVSHPSYDPNLFVSGIRAKDWRALADNPYGILNNKTISGLYAPGSTIKMIIGLAALESKKILKDQRFVCPGFIDVQGHRYHCWRNQYGHGLMNLASAIRESCDVYFYEVAKILGHQPIVQMAKHFGLGQKTGIELMNEKIGLVPNRSWKILKKQRPWTLGDTILTSIGQGYFLTTPLQLATMTAQLVNGGFKVTPHLQKNVHPQTQTSLQVNPDHLKIIVSAMSDVVNHSSGTAFGSRLPSNRYKMGGKTGTSQVRRISIKERLSGVLRNEDIAWIRRDHSLFVAYAPVDDVKLTVAVVVEHGGSGSKIASYIARDILNFYQTLTY